MKKFKITKLSEPPKQNTLELTLTDVAKKNFESILAYFEVEILQGEYRILENGMHYYKFHVPNGKTDIVKAMQLSLISDASMS